MNPGSYHPSRRTIAPTEIELEYPQKLPEEILMQCHRIKGRPHIVRRYNQTLIMNDWNVFGLTDNGILYGNILSWDNYFDKFKGKVPWMDEFAICLEIYNGTLKGFANSNEERMVRDSAIQNYIKEFIKETITEMLTTPEQKTLLETTIELCIDVSICDFLFTDMLKIFTKNSLESTFINALEPHILNGKLKETKVSQELMKLFIKHYLTTKKFDIFENLLLSLDLSNQDLEVLSDVCFTRKMFSAIIYIKNLQEGDFHRMEPALYMHKEMKILAKDCKDDIDMKSLLRPENANKPTNKSYKYLAYKILWYIRKCFKGEKYPHRSDDTLAVKDWPNLVYCLLQWMFIEKNKIPNIKEIVDLDAKTVFEVISILFEHPHVRSFITELEKYETKSFPGINYQQILKKLTIVAELSNIPSTLSLHYFYLFFAHVGSQAEISGASETCIKAAKYLMQNPDSREDINRRDLEVPIMRMLMNCTELKPDAELLEIERRLIYIDIEVYLTELQGDYSRCFHIYFELEDNQSKLFVWLSHMQEAVKGNSEKYKEIKNLIYKFLERIVFCTLF